MPGGQLLHELGPTSDTPARKKKAFFQVSEPHILITALPFRFRHLAKGLLALFLRCKGLEMVAWQTL